MLHQQISHASQSFIARNKRYLSRLNLSNASPHFREVCAGYLGRNILSQARNQPLGEFGANIRW